MNILVHVFWLIDIRVSVSSFLKEEMLAQRHTCLDLLDDASFQCGWTSLHSLVELRAGPHSCGHLDLSVLCILAILENI